MNVNRRRGEVAAELDGQSFRLCLTLGALAELEAAYEADDLGALVEHFAGGRLSARDLIRIVGAGLRGGGNAVTDDEVAEILDHAEGLGYQLVTTAKDSVRLAGGHGRSEELRKKSRVIEVEIRFDDPKGPDAIIDAAIANARRRKLQRLAAKV